MKIGFVCLPLSGHLDPMAGLATAIRERGHEVVMLGVPDAEASARTAGLPFASVCKDVYPIGSDERLWRPIRKMRGLDVMRYWSDHIHPAFLDHLLSELPGAIAQNNINALVFDTACTFGEVAAMIANIPYVQVWLVLNFDASGTTPPCLFDWPHEAGNAAQFRNLEGVDIAEGIIVAPFLEIVRRHLSRAGMAVEIEGPQSTASRRAIVSQTPAAFDYLGIPWPPHFHQTGAFVDARTRAPVIFPWERITDAPLIYASLGSLVNGHSNVLRSILGALGRLMDHQAVLVADDAVDEKGLGVIPPNVIIVRWAPQADLLARACLCITNGGFNTVLEALGMGVPLAVLPIAYDNPGVAARIRYHGVGDFTAVADATTDAVSKLIGNVLGNPAYKQAAERLSSELKAADGRHHAAEIIEYALAPPT